MPYPTSRRNCIGLPFFCPFGWVLHVSLPCSNSDGPPLVSQTSGPILLFLRPIFCTKFQKELLSSLQTHPNQVVQSSNCTRKRSLSSYSEIVLLKASSFPGKMLSFFLLADISRQRKVASLQKKKKESETALPIKKAASENAAGDGCTSSKGKRPFLEG